jgi:formylglycine-generating enzyme required for sulfatase activity
VDWKQATTFARWAGGRLPTGEEWTHAATSGGQSWDYPWGDETATCDRAIMSDGGSGCGEGHTWPVCSKPAGNSTQGVCDLAGNVWEWTDEREAASDRVSRGGGWILFALSLRASYRSGLDPSYRLNNLGFRVAR